jgi:hypothetical protein
MMPTPMHAPERPEADDETDADARIGLDHRHCLQLVHLLSFLY